MAGELKVDERCVVSDVAASSFDDLFRREQAPMLGLAILMVGSQPEAEEVVHDAFVHVLERWDRIVQPGAYLRRCVVNGCISHTRRRRRQYRLPPPAPPSADLEVDHTFEALRHLPARRRAIVVLRYYADLTQEDIAEVLGIKVGTVKSGLHRALSQLREVLGDD